jgi:hypothetical protein
LALRRLALGVLLGVLIHRGLPDPEKKRQAVLQIIAIPRYWPSFAPCPTLFSEPFLSTRSKSALSSRLCISFPAFIPLLLFGHSARPGALLPIPTIPDCNSAHQIQRNKDRVIPPFHFHG